MGKSRKIVIVGCGEVGSTFAFTVLLKGLVNELILIDKNRKKALGDVLDLNHGLMLTQPVNIKAGGFEDCKDADIIVIAAGAAQMPGETRIDLMNRNVAIFREIIGEINKHNQSGILLVATNPVDILTQVALKLSGWKRGHVIGSGTLLDTSRFRYLIGDTLKVDPRSVHGLIIGEHGDSEVPLWSSLTVAGINVASNDPGSQFYLSPEQKDRIFHNTKNAAYQIIENKGATNYAIALALARICESILEDQKSILPVSCYLENYLGVSDVCLGVPAIIGKDGIEQIVSLPLSDTERELFQRSAGKLKELLTSIGF
ncbi:L-lactate dehydrogenase [Brevibacillus sp. SYP-B805]|uniref:L-lactate dehydrogenase n=1 Tax=Brevibacillus sp. SYP-B805 TaxID=1578199 RepID=UPI0013EE071F|nr:L-lactate dehydrogenase [Brevibacillus sp. SYP-B805]NGQ97498.1 L-lactate dehydrogenase [Brevibacillus sp. SYP-B805]